jgi:hypothetical protein
MYGSKGKLAKLNYMDIKLLLDRCIVKNIRENLTEREIQMLVKDWHDRRSEGDLILETIEMETKLMEKKLRKYNVEQQGEMPFEREDGTMWILVCQMGGCASVEAREFKIAATEKLICKYDISLCLFMELNFNWTKVNSSANLALWFSKEEREMCCITAHNTQEFNKLFGKHQRGGTGMVCIHEFLQYARKPSADLRGLGRWCTWPFFCNPSHITRIVAAYRPCARKVERLKAVYQQHVQYIQAKGLKYNPVKLFDHDLSKQIKEWQTQGERIVLLMDVNDHPLHNKFYTTLKEQTTNMEEFTHKCWGPKEPYTHHLGKSPIDGGYKSPEVEIVNPRMLNFAESPGNHKSLLFDISTRSLLGKFRYKVCHPVSRGLVTSQADSVEHYNKIVRDQFEVHRIIERMDTVDKMTKYCGNPSP